MTEAKISKIDEIHMSLVKGKRQKMVKLIDEYGLYDFWEDYREYLSTIPLLTDGRYSYFADAVISYHRIKDRYHE